MEGVSRKRATMMIDSEDEDEDDIPGVLPRPALKKTKKSDVEVEDLASGPPDFIKALTNAGFHPRSGTLPNILSVTIVYFRKIYLC